MKNNSEKEKVALLTILGICEILNRLAIAENKANQQKPEQTWFHFVNQF